MTADEKVCLNNLTKRPLATKVGQIRHQLDAGTAVIVYDEATDSWTIQPTDQLSEPP